MEDVKLGSQFIYKGNNYRFEVEADTTDEINGIPVRKYSIYDNASNEWAATVKTQVFAEGVLDQKSTRITSLLVDDTDSGKADEFYAAGVFVAIAGSIKEGYEGHVIASFEQLEIVEAVTGLGLFDYLRPEDRNLYDKKREKEATIERHKNDPALLGEPGQDASQAVHLKPTEAYLNNLGDKKSKYPEEQIAFYNIAKIEAALASNELTFVTQEDEDVYNAGGERVGKSVKLVPTDAYRKILEQQYKDTVIEEEYKVKTADEYRAANRVVLEEEFRNMPVTDRKVPNGISYVAAKSEEYAEAEFKKLTQNELDQLYNDGIAAFLEGANRQLSDAERLQEILDKGELEYASEDDEDLFKLLKEHNDFSKAWRADPDFDKAIELQVPSRFIDSVKDAATSLITDDLWEKVEELWETEQPLPNPDAWYTTCFKLVFCCGCISALFNAIARLWEPAERV